MALLRRVGNAMHAENARVVIAAIASRPRDPQVNANLLDDAVECGVRDTTERYRPLDRDRGRGWHSSTQGRRVVDPTRFYPPS